MKALMISHNKKAGGSSKVGAKLNEVILAYPRAFSSRLQDSCHGSKHHILTLAHVRRGWAQRRPKRVLTFFFLFIKDKNLSQKPPRCLLLAHEPEYCGITTLIHCW